MFFFKYFYWYCISPRTKKVKMQLLHKHVTSTMYWICHTKKIKM